jgi:ribosomal-protein-alanine N-acetyltransferase
MTPPFFVEQPDIVTERLLLRKLSPDDAPAVFEYGSRDAVTRNVLFPQHESLADSEAFLAKIFDQKGIEFGVVWGIVLKENGKLIGTIGLHHINLENKRLEVGYALHDDYWNKGIVTEATKALIDSVYSNTTINRIEALCVSDHVRSYRVMEKAGMQFEGILRQASLMKSGLCDMRIYSILREDYARGTSSN